MEITSHELCTGCGACAQICPKKCVSFSFDIEGFYYPTIDEDACINCDRCKKVCPQNEIVNGKSNRKEAYAVRAKEEDVIRSSSSGGAFYLLAKEILRKGGIVFGVALSEDCKYAMHIKISNESELYKLQGSKYIQSRNQNIYQEVKSVLISGKAVLYSGTPCQVNGLKKFLSKPYDNLVCIEVVCHGVPSERLWVRYIDYLEKKYNGRVHSVNFREKKEGWNNFGVKIKCNNIEQFLPLTEDPYLRIFLNDYCLRLSCYNCHAKETSSKADISLADFWGVEKVIPEFSDDKGTSLVLINSEKGRTLFDSISDQCEFKVTTYDDAIKMNPSGFFSVEMPQKRNSFYIDLNKSSDFKRLIRKYAFKNKTEYLKDYLRKTCVYRIYKIVRGGGNTTRYN